MASALTGGTIFPEGKGNTAHLVAALAQYFCGIIGLLLHNHGIRLISAFC